MNLFIKLFSSSYEELWKAIIRPYRDEYTQKELGPERFILEGKYYKRSDFSLINKRNMKLMCSFWEPYDEEREFPLLPCVVYLHGNSSSRCEALLILKYLLPLNITVFSFDFAGCGHSEGEYISLGWYETLDVQCIINYLRKSNKVSTIGLWGRSMGAVTSLIYASKDPSIGGIFLDSPFYSLNLLIDELSNEKVSFPNFLVKQVVKILKETVKEKGKFNIDDIEPVKFAKKCFVPAFFSHGKDDTFVNMHHCKDLYNTYSGEKSILLVEGDHNSLRPSKINEKAVEFFYNALKCKYVRELNDYYKGYKLMYKNCNLITPNGDKENKMKNNNDNKSTNCKNNGDTVSVIDIEEPRCQKKIIKKKVTLIKFNKACNINKKEKFVMSVCENNNKINIKKKIENFDNYKQIHIHKEKTNNKNNKNIKQNNISTSLSTAKKEEYFMKTFTKVKTKVKGKKNKLSTSESNVTKYNILKKEKLMINTQNINNIDNQYFCNNTNNINIFDSLYNTNDYVYKTNMAEGDMFLKKIKLNHSQNNETTYAFSQQNFRYFYPAPMIVNSSENLTNMSYNNKGSNSPSYIINTCPKKDNYSLYEKNLSNNLYNSENNLCINDYNYNNLITRSNYGYNY